MSEVRNEISKMNIRGELNLLYSMSRLIVSILDAVPDSKVACDTLRSVSENILNQAAYLHGKVSLYTDELNNSEKRNQAKESW